MIYFIDGCPTEETKLPGPPGFEDLFLILVWPETNLGDNATIECPCGGIDLNSTGLIATRFCGGTYEDGAMWQSPYDVRCNFSVTTRRICKLAEVYKYKSSLGRYHTLCRDHRMKK